MPKADDTEDNAWTIKPDCGKDGKFQRPASSFRDAIEEGGYFAPEKGRYHLYVSLACPWAHRTLIVRKLKGLDDFFDYSVVDPRMLSEGWSFDADFEAATGDKLKLGGTHLRNVYKRVQPDYNGRFTVPVIYDTKTDSIVSNESSEIIRFLNTAFNSLLPEGDQKELDLYPEALRSEIDELNTWVYDTVNNGVYKAGFASTQKAYDEAVVAVFESLDRLEKMLEGKDYLLGNLTEADVRLYTTIIRFDPVYHGHFKCNLGMIRHSYPEIHRWMKQLYHNNPAFKDTTNFAQIKEHYYYSHAQINPTRVVPLGPKVDVEAL